MVNWNRVLFSLQALAIALASASAFARNTIIYVNGAASGMNDGTSWADAYNDLQDAIALAAEIGTGVQIWVAQGTYAPGPPGVPLDSTSFGLVSGVALYGGFGGFESHLDERDWEQYLTLLTGDLAGDGSQRVRHVLTGLSLGEGSILDGFTVAEGSAFGGFHGGGLRLQDSNLEISNCIFAANFATFGGAVSADASTLSIENCQFTSNTGDLDGGAIYALDSTLDFTNVEFDSNRAWEHGGAIQAIDSALTASHCDFIGNKAELGGTGGAVHATGEVAIEHCVFTENTSWFASSAMRAVGQVHINNCVFDDNPSDGPVVTGSGSWTIEDSMFTNNSGALAITANFLITGSQFIDNYADFSPGGASIGGSGTVTDCLFWGNFSSTYGGGLYLHATGLITISNSHLWVNGAAFEGGGILSVGSGEVRIIDSVIEGNYAGYGGAASARNGSLVVERCTVFQNGGGLHASYGGTLTVIDSIVSDNWSEGVLVGFGFGDPAEAIIVNSLIKNNIGNGVRIGVDSGPPGHATIINSTIVNNKINIPAWQAGVSVVSGHADVRNSIIWNNKPDGADAMESHQINVLDGTVDVSHSIIHMLTPGGMFDIPGANNSGDDPLFVNPNPTPGSGDEADFRLQPRSPAIDAGSNAFVPDPDEFPGADTDLDGNPRIIDGTGDGVAIVDLGAYEFQPAAPSIPGDLNGDGSVGVADLLILLANWGPCADCAPGTSAPGNCPADLTGDCEVGVADLLILLANWG